LLGPEWFDFGISSGGSIGNVGILFVDELESEFVSIIEMSLLEVSSRENNLSAIEIGKEVHGLSSSFLVWCWFVERRSSSVWISL